MQAFWLALTMTFWAEMGDKSQLLVMGYSTRYPFYQVLSGILIGTLAVLLAPALFGGWIGQAIPHVWMHSLAALCFIGVGFWTLRDEGDEKNVASRFQYPVLAIAATLFLSEFGDKTMLATITLASTMNWLPVWLGASAGMILADIGVVFVGRVLHKTIPEKQVRWLAAALFFGFAAWSAYKAFRAWGAL